MRLLVRLLIVVDVLILHGVVGFVGYSLYSKQTNGEADQVVVTEDEVSLPATTIRSYVDQCGPECQKVITARLVEFKKEILTSTPQAVLTSPDPSVRTTPTPKYTKVRREEIFTIPGAGTVTQNDWTQITATAFYFDTRDYPGLSEVYFEANINLENGNGTAYVRLYDATHGIGVNGSENTTSSQSAVWTKSQKVYFWAGRNLIYVQAKSLTADQVGYFNGRLRLVIYE